MVKFSLGNIEDYDDVIGLCGTWWKDSLFYKLYQVDYSPDKGIFEQLSKLGYLVVILGHNEDNKLVACYIGLKSPYPFNKEISTVIEMVWCVHPEYRNFKTTLGLLKAIDKYMLTNKINFYSLAVSEESKYESLAKIMMRSGYSKMETGYSKFRRYDGALSQ